MHGQVDSEILVYWVVLEKGPIGIRDIQKIVGFGSPSTAIYHLEKLKNSGLIRRDSYGKYYATKPFRPGILRFYVLFGRYLIPKALMYSITLSILEFVVLYLSNFRLEMLLSLSPALLATLIFWYETFDLLKLKRDLFRRRSKIRTLNSKV